jgi:hypothetical protein
MAADEPLSEVFATVCELAEKLGVRNINALPGCWEHRIDAQWTFALNGHDAPVKDSRGCEVPAFTIAVYWGDWLAGLVSPIGGTVAASTGANEDALCEALRRAIDG